MSNELSVTSQERTHLRELARQVAEIAHLPVMAERTELWYAHNALKAPRPVVVFESWGCVNDIIPPLTCTSPLAKRIEWALQWTINDFRLVGDDKVVSPEYRINWNISLREFDLVFETHRGTDEKGRSLAWVHEHPIKDLATDLPKLKKSAYSVDRDATMATKAAIEGIFGDIMPVVLQCGMEWHAAPSGKIVKLMGMEAMLMAMMDQPEAMKALYQFLVDDILDYARWLERENLLTPDNGNHYAGAGSYGFTHELAPVPGQVKLRDIWVNLNSQETVGISPAMFEEFAGPAYHQLAEPFGLAYYGCCEPVHDIWDTCIGKLPHLRKVSISPWCNEEAMGERLRKAPVIYSRKPSPNFVGVGKLDEQAYAEHIATTLRAAKGAHLEFICRDVYALDGDKTKAGRAVKIIREQIDKMW